MGTLANTLFQALMGWVRMLSAEIWNTVFSPDRMTLAGWIGQHWKILALGLCAVGLALDLTVYLFRWQPYRVWRSRRLRGKSRLPETPDAAEEFEEADASAADTPAETAVREENPVPGREPLPVRTVPGGRPAAIPDQRYANWMSDEPSGDSDAENPYRAFRRPVPAGRARRNPPEEAGAPYRYPLPGERLQEEEKTTARFEQAIRPRRRNRVAALLSEKQDEGSPAPDQLIDRKEAYRRPVYPRSWKAENEDPR